MKTDSDWAGSLDDQRALPSTFCLGNNFIPGAQEIKNVLHYHLMKLNTFIKGNNFFKDRNFGGVTK